MESLPLDLKHDIEQRAFKMNYDAVVCQIPTQKLKTSKLELEWSPGGVPWRYGDEIYVTISYQCYSKVNAEEIMDELGCYYIEYEYDDDTYTLIWSGYKVWSLLEYYKINMDIQLSV